MYHLYRRLSEKRKKSEEEINSNRKLRFVHGRMDILYISTLKNLCVVMKIDFIAFALFEAKRSTNRTILDFLALIQQAKPSDRPIVCLIYTGIQRYRSTRSVYKSFSDFYTISIFLLFNFPLSSPKFCEMKHTRKKSQSLRMFHFLCLVFAFI